MSYLAHICNGTSARDVLIRDVPNDAIQPDPWVHLRLDGQDQFEQLIFGVGHVQALAVPLVDDCPWHNAARINLRRERDNRRLQQLVRVSGRRFPLFPILVPRSSQKPPTPNRMNYYTD